MSTELPSFAATPFVECCIGAVVVLCVLLGWLLIHEEPTRSERNADLDEAGNEWGGDR